MVRRRVFSQIILAIVLLTVSGCACSGVCSVPPNPDTTLKVLMSPPTRGTQNPALTQPRPKTQLQLSVDPLSLTIGAIITGLRDIIHDLSNLVDTTSGDLKSVIIQTQASAEQLAADLEKRFQNQLGNTVRALGNVEQQIALDAYNATNSMRAGIDQARAAADETALTVMQGADIATYNALFDLPCRERIPRAVYITPRSVRVWGDPGAPSEGPNKQTMQFIVRGNYLDAFGQPQASVNGKPVSVDGSNRRELYISFTPEIVDSLLQLSQATQVVVKTSLALCEAGQREASDVALLVKPPINYLISGRIVPTVQIPYRSTKNYSFYEDGGCDSNYRVDKSYPVDPGTTVTECSVGVTTANCGSNVSSAIPSGSICVVSGKIVGCGRDCIPLTGICNCRGRGWLGYNVSIDYEGMRSQILQTYEFPPVTHGGATSYVFQYQPGLPEDRDSTQTICDYYLRIIVQEGGQNKVVELTSGTPPPVGFQVTRDINTCAVSLTIQPPTTLAK
jgi:hypothetical protein